MSEFSDLTRRITKRLSKTEKKEHGIFITPRNVIERLIKKTDTFIESLDIEIEDVLEPSCGTCEIIQYLDTNYSGLVIDGVEYNSTIFDEIKNIQFSADNTIALIHSDFLRFRATKQYDMIIGNPPYVVCPVDSVPVEYRQYVVGRPNLFGAFILHSLSMLRVGGILSFIIPTSFLNAAYYAKIREYILTTCDILSIINFEKDCGFIDTQQSTFGLILRKTDIARLSIPLCKHSFKFNDSYIFTENADKLKDILAGSTTLKALGLSVKTGTVVWNQHKDILTHDNTKTLLLYNSNLVNNEIKTMTFKNDEKKQYIDMTGTTNSVIVVNRGNGTSAYVLSYSLVQSATPYLIENHLNYIYSNEMSDVERNRVFDIVLNSFNNPKTQKFIDVFLGNNGLSKTELETIFPIYLDDYV
jgi:adenine-specific DNA-methyltransferase